MDNLSEILTKLSAEIQINNVSESTINDLKKYFTPKGKNNWNEKIHLSHATAILISNLNNTKLIEGILDSFDEEFLFDVLNNKDKKLLPQALMHPKSFEVILKRLPPNKVWEVLFEIQFNQAYKNIFEHAKNHHSKKELLPIIFAQVVRYLSSGPKKGLEALQATNENGFKLLHEALHYPESLKAILETLPENARLKALQATNENGFELLHEALDYPESLKAILETLPENARLIALQATKDKKSILEIIEESEVLNFKDVIAILPPDNSTNSLRIKLSEAIIKSTLEPIRNFIYTNKQNTFANHLQTQFGQSDGSVWFESPSLSNFNGERDSALIEAAMVSAISACQSSWISDSKDEKLKFLNEIKQSFKEASDTDKPKLFAAFIKTAAAARTKYKFSIFSPGVTASLDALMNTLKRKEELTAFIISAQLTTSDKADESSKVPQENKRS